MGLSLIVPELLLDKSSGYPKSTKIATKIEKIKHKKIEYMDFLWTFNNFCGLLRHVEVHKNLLDLRLLHRIRQLAAHSLRQLETQQGPNQRCQPENKRRQPLPHQDQPRNKGRRHRAHSCKHRTRPNPRIPDNSGEQLPRVQIDRWEGNRQCKHINRTEHRPDPSGLRRNASDQKTRQPRQDVGEDKRVLAPPCRHRPQREKRAWDLHNCRQRDVDEDVAPQLADVLRPPEEAQPAGEPVVPDAGGVRAHGGGADQVQDVPAVGAPLELAPLHVGVHVGRDGGCGALVASRGQLQHFDGVAFAPHCEQPSWGLGQQPVVGQQEDPGDADGYVEVVPIPQEVGEQRQGQ
ncbi:hypothetical protein TcasGA2_TC011041 [Tribolium castaneum]|uniref:Uncharacterized protein n=1 Tax=Tribolium castaneum TaxID=7070 RepID=D6X4T9_TRICA|nr:hypothetical protein TcasGA2_TC011041 [Tribolium castaneum]